VIDKVLLIEDSLHIGEKFCQHIVDSEIFGNCKILWLRPYNPNLPEDALEEFSPLSENIKYKWTRDTKTTCEQIIPFVKKNTIIFYDLQLIGVQDSKKVYDSDITKTLIDQVTMQEQALILVHSGQSDINSDHFAANMTSQNPKLNIEHFPSLQNAKDMNVFFADALKKWHNFFRKDFHEDSGINDMLNFFIKAWEDNWSERFHWSHNQIEKKPRYCEEFKQYFGITSEVANNDIKALFMYGGNGIDYGKWYPFSSDMVYAPPKNIKRNTLKMVLKKLLLDIEIDDAIGEELALPIIPALPFLLSLRYFVSLPESLKNIESMKLYKFNNKYYEHYAIAVECKNESDYSKLVQTYFTKKDNEFFTGSSQALNNIMWRKTLELSSPDNYPHKEVIEKFKNGQDMNGEKLSTPCVSYLFAKKGFHMCWTGHQLKANKAIKER